MQALLPVINGVTTGTIIFLVAAGLTIVFGIARVLNFAHGGVFMFAAFTMFSATQRLGTEPLQLLLAAGAAIAVAGALGVLIEVTLVRRFYDLQHEYMLLGTFAILLIIDGVVELIWGLDPRYTPPPAALRGPVEIAGAFIPKLSLFIIALGLVSAAGLLLWLRSTSFGRVARASSHDPAASQALGVNVPLVMTLVFAISSVLAGLAGAVLAPNQSLDIMLGSTFIIQAFAVVVVGGLGSVGGAFIAAMLLGVTESLWFAYLPGVPQVGLFVAMVLVLAVRPTGIFGSQV